MDNAMSDLRSSTALVERKVCIDIDYDRKAAATMESGGGKKMLKGSKDDKDGAEGEDKVSVVVD